ncbi:hypothetical protein M8C21_005493, partial [Ambrosia artemisiifolia]
QSFAKHTFNYYILYLNEYNSRHCIVSVQQKEPLKMNTRSMYKSERMSLDRITTLPQPILETILCHLSTKEAVRTSILSREWRYNWTKIPKLELSPCMGVAVYEQTSDIANTRRCKPCYDIYQILLRHQGPIHELTLTLPEDNCLELDQIILHLSRNYNFKKLKLYGSDLLSWYKLPICLFSFHHIRDLVIYSLDLDLPPTFNGFSCLESLCLRGIGISIKSLLRLLSNSPSLKSFNLFVSEAYDTCTVNELLECLPMIEHLSLTMSPYISECVVLDSVPQELPTSLIHLRYLCFEDMCFDGGCHLPFLLAFIKRSPNLEKIKLENDWCEKRHEEYSVVWDEYSNVWLEHLNELKIVRFNNLKPEMDFVKFILARSPKLKNVIEETPI